MRNLIFGTLNNDILTGSHRRDYIIGDVRYDLSASNPQGGNDRIDGAQGYDYLIGDAGVMI